MVDKETNLSLYNNPEDTVIDSLTKSLGSGPENIKIIKNWMPEKDIKTFLEYTRLISNQSSIEEEIRYQKAYYERELAKAYEHLMRAEATSLYNREFLKDRTVDFNGRTEEVENHTDFIKPQFYDPLILKPENKNYGWSGHLSTIVYLNNDFEGGEIYFPQHEILIKPEPGLFVAFPGNTNYFHSVKSFKGNKRCTISLWTQFKDFR